MSSDGYAHDEYHRTVTISGHDLAWLEEMAEKLIGSEPGSAEHIVYSQQIAAEVAYHLRKPDGDQ